MPPLLELDINSQNGCCERALRYIENNGDGVSITYRELVRSRIWDSYCLATNTSPHIAFLALDDSLFIHCDTLKQIDYKFKCSEFVHSLPVGKS